MTASASDTTRTYVIFGASGGIGSALARRLAATGANLMLVARREDALAALATELDASGRVRYRAAEASDFAAADAAADEALATFGSVHGVANCAGSLLLKPAHLTRTDEFDATITANLTTAFAAVRAAARVMPNGGSVVLCSSAAARTGMANHEAIAAAKGGVLGLVLSAAATYAPRGLRVNAVAPGLVRTPLTARITGSDTALKASQSMHALGRIGEPDEVAALMAWLLGEESTWVTGQCYGIDGGLGAVRSR